MGSFQLILIVFRFQSTTNFFNFHNHLWRNLYAHSHTCNPRKKFPWTVEFEGLEPALIQQVTLPTVSVKAAEHGCTISGNYGNVNNQAIATIISALHPIIKCTGRKFL